jgi:chemotaxis protein MotB
MSVDEPDSDLPAPRNKSKGNIIPRYMGTFADLMTLLLCFFVLLVAMAEIDALKFKVVVRSMENAFGIERPKPEEVVKGTSIIQQRFSPNPENPTPLDSVLQNSKTNGNSLNTKEAVAIQVAKTQRTHERLKSRLLAALDGNLISIDALPDRVLIRINEQASFPSGSAALKPGFEPVLKLIAAALVDIDAQFVVAGHTDNVPLHSGLYRSNWELSAARATSVVHALLSDPRLKANQFHIEAYADTQPLDSNETTSGRAMNRRVEIGIINT